MDEIDKEAMIKALYDKFFNIFVDDNQKEIDECFIHIKTLGEAPNVRLFWSDKENKVKLQLLPGSPSLRSVP